METPFDSTTYNCRLDQVGASFIQIVTVDFVLSKVIALGVSYANVAKAKATNKDFKREEFTVSKKMVNLLYFQGLIFLTITYAPLFTFIVLIFQVSKRRNVNLCLPSLCLHLVRSSLQYSSFKFEKMMLFKFGTKPKKEWKAQDAGNFFVKFYLFTIVVTGLMSVFFFLSSKTHAKEYNLLNSIIEDNVGYCEDAATEGCTRLKDKHIRYNVSAYKCGPFTNETSAWVMVQTDISSFSLISQMVYQVRRGEGGGAKRW